MIRRRLTAAAAVALLGLTLAGCGGSRNDPIDYYVDDVQAQPSATATRAPVAPDSCDPKASLRPAGALPAPGHMPADSYMAEIQKRGRLIVGTSQDTYLFSSRNPANGQIEGFDVDMAREVARAIFGDPNKIDIRVVKNADRVKKLTGDDPQVDLIAQTMTVTCDRWADVNFSTVYYQAGQKVLVPKNSDAKGIDDLGGKTVCTTSGSTSIATLKAKGVTTAEKASFGDCMVAFQRGEVYAVSTDDSILDGLAAEDPYAKVVGPAFTQEPYGMAMSNLHDDFTQFVNAVLAQERADGTWAKLYGKWLGRFGPAPQPPVAVYK